MSCNRNFAASFKRGQQSTFGGHCKTRRLMIQDRKPFHRRGIVVTAGDPERSLTDRRKHEVFIENLADDGFASQASQAGKSENDGVELALGEFSKPRIDIAAQR